MVEIARASHFSPCRTRGASLHCASPEQTTGRKARIMSRRRIELPQGALELLVLRTLARRREHGYGVVKAIRERSEDALEIEEGSLYPALHRMERHGWIEAEWGVSDTGRRAKYYSLTKDGRGRLKAARGAWERMTGAIGLVLGGRAAGA